MSKFVITFVLIVASSFTAWSYIPEHCTFDSTSDDFKHWLDINYNGLSLDDARAECFERIDSLGTVSAATTMIMAIVLILRVVPPDEEVKI